LFLLISFTSSAISNEDKRSNSHFSLKNLQKLSSSLLKTIAQCRADDYLLMAFAMGLKGHPLKHCFLRFRFLSNYQTRKAYIHRMSQSFQVISRVFLVGKVDVITMCFANSVVWNSCWNWSWITLFLNHKHAIIRRTIKNQRDLILAPSRVVNYLLWKLSTTKWKDIQSTANNFKEKERDNISWLIQISLLFNYYSIWLLILSRILISNYLLVLFRNSSSYVWLINN